MSTVATTSQPVTSSTLRRLISGHPLLAYFVIAFVGTWLFTAAPLLLARNGIGLLPFTLPVDLFTTLGTFTGPTLSALIVTAATSGKVGVWKLLRRIIQWRVGIQWYFVALFGYMLVDVLTTVLAFGVASLSTVIQHWSLLFTLYLPALVMFRLINPLGEETGWSGFALPRLQQKYGALLGAVILGTLWSLWHLPSFFYVGGGQQGFSIPGFVVFIILGILARIIWTWVFNNASGSILIAILLHAASNATQYDLLPRLIAPFNVNSPAAGLWFEALFLASALLIIIFTRGRLSYKPDRNAQLVMER